MVSIFAFFLKNDQKNGINIYNAVGNKSSFLWEICWGILIAQIKNIDSKRVLKIALPIMLTNITVPLLGFVDTVVIGQLGDAKLIAALGLGSILITTLYGLFGFLRMGTTGLAAQAKGSEKHNEVFFILIRGLLTGLILGLLIFHIV